MNAAAFAAMKPGAFFINASRGKLVDEAALLAALDAGRLGGCALDVGRAPDQMPSPALARHPRVIATPHIGGLTLAGDRAPGARDRRAGGAAARGRDAARRRQSRRTRRAGACAGDERSPTRRGRMSTRRSLRPGACDCHMHFYEDAYPLAPTATFRPPHAPAAAIARCSAARPRARGRGPADRLRPRQPLHAGGVAALGPRRAAVVVVAPTSRMPSSSGCTRAASAASASRCCPAASCPGRPSRRWRRDARARLAHRAAARRPRAAPARGDAAAPAVPLVIDHIGRFLDPVPPDERSRRSPARLLDTGRCWIKLSAPYESSRSGPPDYADVACSPGWSPAHPSAACGPATGRIPNRHPPRATRTMLDWPLGCVDDAATRRRMLVDNPAELYGFAS